MLRFLPGVLLLVIAAAGFPEAAHGQTIITQPGALVADWEALEGPELRLQCLADGTAILQTGVSGDSVRFGRYKAIARGAWSLTVRDDRGRAYYYSIVIPKSSHLSLIDGKGNVHPLQRMAMDFNKLDKNRDGFVTEDELDDPTLARKMYEYTYNQKHRLDRRGFARFLDKYPPR